MTDGEGDTERKQDDEHQGQPDVDGQENDQGAQQRYAAGQNVFRTVMGKLYNLKQIAGDTGHQNAGPVAVKEREGQRLHVRKHIATHIRLHQRSHAVPDDGDEILKPGPQLIGGKENCHHGKERGKLLLRQQAVHRVPRHIGEGQIHQRHRQRQAHIECESGSMRADIGSKDREL